MLSLPFAEHLNSLFEAMETSQAALGRAKMARVRHLLAMTALATCLGSLVISLGMLQTGRIEYSALIIVAAALGATLLMRLVDHGYSGRPIMLGLTGGMSAMLASLAWMNSGIADPAVFVVPSVLMLSAYLQNRRDFLMLCVLNISNVMALAALTNAGWFKPRVDITSNMTPVLYALILGYTAYIAWVITSDWRRHVLLMQRNLDAAEAARSDAQFSATHDALTGLPNRSHVEARCIQMLATSRVAGTKLAVLHLDLRSFSSVNEGLGHAQGDLVLQQIATRVQPLITASDCLGRMSGDEFIIVLSDANGQDRVAQLATVIMTEIGAPMIVDAVEVSIQSAVGIAIFPTDGETFSDLLKKATVATDSAKTATTSQYRFFNEQMTMSTSAHLQLMSDLRRALSNGQLIVHYQPQFDLINGRIIGAEALLRWRHPVIGPVSPVEFIPMAEETGLIVPIGTWVLHEACVQAKRWHELGHTQFEISVNVSAVQFRQPQFAREVATVLADTRLPPESLVLEFTESVLIDASPSLMAMLSDLRLLGVQLALDDFGTGYSNLAYLKRFNVALLKIDRSFVSRIADNERDRVIVKAITQMAHSLGLRTLAEGIESANVAEHLQTLGCDQGQGFLWAPALAAEAMEDLLRKDAAGVAVAA